MWWALWVACGAATDPSCDALVDEASVEAALGRPVDWEPYQGGTHCVRTAREGGREVLVLDIFQAMMSTPTEGFDGHKKDLERAHGPGRALPVGVRGLRFDGPGTTVFLVERSRDLLRADVDPALAAWMEGRLR